jgi:hypothetical protein
MLRWRVHPRSSPDAPPASPWPHTTRSHPLLPPQHLTSVEDRVPPPAAPTRTTCSPRAAHVLPPAPSPDPSPGSSAWQQTVKPNVPHGPHHRCHMAVRAGDCQLDLLSDGSQHLSLQRQTQGFHRSIREHGEVRHRAVLNPPILAEGMTEQVGAIDLVTDFLGDRGDMDREVRQAHAHKYRTICSLVKTIFCLRYATLNHPKASPHLHQDPKPIWNFRQEGCRACLLWVTSLCQVEVSLPLSWRPPVDIRGIGQLVSRRKEGPSGGHRPAPKVHHFAKLRGLTNKTDRQDAILLAQFGASEPVAPSTSCPLPTFNSVPLPGSDPRL